MLRSTLAALALCSTSWAGPITLSVDATDAPRRIFRANLQIQTTPGPLTLVYPKWIPGEHGPTGPLAAVGGLHIRAGDQELAWRRDLNEPYALTCQVPPGVSSISVDMTSNAAASEGGSFSAGPSSTPNLAVISWNHYVLYPQGTKAADQRVQAELKAPAGWKVLGTLPVQSSTPQSTTFAPTSLEMLVDHPILLGKHARTIDLTPGQQPPHAIDMIADSAVALEISDENIKPWRALIGEAAVLFGSRHYQRYHFLLTLSDHVGNFGLEHHECSDDRVEENSLQSDFDRRDVVGLLAHEYVHSWNGKFRRPVGLATPNFQTPMRDDLLWVYEGLTNYYGGVLTARSGALTEEQYRDELARTAAAMDLQEGRSWRPLQDTADAASVLYVSPRSSHLRGTDFYPEGDLIWLDADTHIRELTNNQKSLDDFCRAFHGAGSGLAGEAPTVKPYTDDELFAALNAVAPANWREFFESRLNSKQRGAPMGGIIASGWELTFTDEPNTAESDQRPGHAKWALGLSVNGEGEVQDAVRDYPGFKAGIAAGMQIVAVNGRKFSQAQLKEALRGSKDAPGAIEFIVRSDDFFSTVSVPYSGGLRYPHLKRREGTPDRLKDIMSPKAG